MHKAVQKIAEEISRSGVIPFSRFMDLALYCPDCGYYEAEKDILGKRGDFITSVSIGSLFGELLAFRFTGWLQQWTRTCPLPAKIAEAGAHDGTLAADILGWIERRRPTLFERVEYIIVEPSKRRREWQRCRLDGFHSKVRWTTDLESLSSGTGTGFAGILFANELLDAFPVQRLGWNASRKTWFEWGVAFKNGEFTWSPMEGPSPGVHPLLSGLPPELLDLLPDGFTTEVSLEAVDWWTRASRLVQHGALVAFDYGLTTEEFFLPHRLEGTLRAYRSHRLSSNILSNPGEQDLTAHVNFSLIQETGEKNGHLTHALVRQSQFLTDIAGETWQRPDDFEGWDQRRTRQFQTLTHPEGLGRSHRVLIQSRPETPCR